MTEQSPRQAEPGRPPLDPIFPQLTSDLSTPEAKLIGFIAFGLYEEARREWASEFRDREGRYPDESEVRAYEKSWTASRLEGLRGASVQLVAAYADVVAGQLESEMLRGALKGRFWRGVGVWLFSAVCFALVALGVFVALSRSGIDPVTVARDLARPLRSASPPATASPPSAEAPILPPANEEADGDGRPRQGAPPRRPR